MKKLQLLRIHKEAADPERKKARTGQGWLLPRTRSGKLCYKLPPVATGYGGRSSSIPASETWYLLEYYSRSTENRERDRGSETVKKVDIIINLQYRDTRRMRDLFCSFNVFQL